MRTLLVACSFLGRLSQFINLLMPRKSRIDAPGALHHVIIRGIERKAIFRDAEDYENFLGRLGKIPAGNSDALLCLGAFA